MTTNDYTYYLWSNLVKFPQGYLPIIAKKKKNFFKFHILFYFTLKIYYFEKKNHFPYKICNH